MKWLAIRATEEDIRSTLESHPSIEILAEGGPKDLRAFLERAETLKRPIGIFTMGGDSIPAETEAGLDIASDERLLAALVDLGTARVKDKGGAIIDFEEFRLSTEAAREVSRRAGLDVSIGLKAVFTPRDADESAPDPKV